MGEHGAMSCTARVYVAGHSLPIKEKIFTQNIFLFFISDSDDSDNEGGLGNVERVVMRPPGHSGKAKKGHLCFDAIYETGFLNALFCSSGDHKPKKLHLQVGNVLGALTFFLK